MKLNKGFTIIELLIVIVIIGILVAITAVSYTGITNGANTAKNQTNAKAIKQGLIACHAKNGTFPALTVAGIDGCGAGVKMPAGITIGVPSSSATSNINITGPDPATGAVVVNYWDLTSGSIATQP